MNSLISDISAMLPAGWNVPDLLIFGVLLALALLLLGLLFRAIRGKQSDLNHALSSALGILFIYGVSALIYTFAPAGFARYLAPLPFVSFQGEYLVLLPLTGIAHSTLAKEVLSMVILAFLVNLLDTWIPKGKKILDWYLLRFLSVIASIMLHYAVTWLFNTFLPGTLAINAPMILLGILGFMLLLGALKFLLGLVLTIASPIIGAIYAFFFSNKIGKQLSKAVLTTIVLMVLVLVLEYCGFTSICISGSALTSHLPVILVLLVLWYLIGHIM